MNNLFDFGISQDDADVEIAGLGLHDGDRLLSIASAGEVPLNILAGKNVTIRAVDVSLPQTYLSRLKLIASLTLDPGEAAAFLGFTPATGKRRIALLHKAASLMEQDERLFWQSHAGAVERGVISTARFERYMSRFSGVMLILLGRRKVLGLMELNTVPEQERFFDAQMNVNMLRRLFSFMFRPARYKNRAVAEQGLQNAGAENKADFYLGRFRRFCTSTLARKNYYLQYYLFRRVLFPEALPAYLSDEGMERVRRNRDRIEFVNESYHIALGRSRVHQFNKFHLSNICDWMNCGDLERLLEAIDAMSDRPFKILSRYLHTAHAVPQSLRSRMKVDAGIEEMLLAGDKFPFYHLVPISSL